MSTADHQDHDHDPAQHSPANLQNLGWAIGYNAIALPIAAGVFYPGFGLMLSPEIAAISMSGSSVIVAVNALLLKRLRLPAVDSATAVDPATAAASPGAVKSSGQ